MVRRCKRIENERRLPGPELLAILALEGTQGIDPRIGYPHHIEHPIEKSQAELAASLLGSLCLVAPKGRTIMGIQGKQCITRGSPGYNSVRLHNLSFPEHVD